MALVVLAALLGARAARPQPWLDQDPPPVEPATIAGRVVPVVGGRAPAPREPAALPLDRRSTVCGERWHVIVLEHAGTLVWDLRQWRLVSFARHLGYFHEAGVGAPACAPDGRHVAIASPYDDSVDVLSVHDGARVARIRVPQPGYLRWTDAGITWWWTATYGLD